MDYFIVPAVERLRDGVDDAEERRRLVRYLAVNIGDVNVLRQLAGVDPEEFASFYPSASKPTLGTDATIDSFLSHFGNPDAPTPPAASQIDDTPTIALLNATIKKHDYQRALEIIQQLNLIYPEKSVYFADQTRFLRKLLLNARSTSNRTA